MSGTDGPDTITGTDENDTISGDSGDVLEGGIGDDILIGGIGNDQLTGGDGFDEALFAGPKSAYIISTVNGVTTVSSAGGEDVLVGVERLVFGDGSVDLASAAFAT